MLNWTYSAFINERVTFVCNLDFYETRHKSKKIKKSPVNLRVSRHFIQSASEKSVILPLGEVSEYAEKSLLQSPL
jgi:hypothetical protein